MWPDEQYIAQLQDMDNLSIIIKGDWHRPRLFGHVPKQWISRYFVIIPYKVYIELRVARRAVTHHDDGGFDTSRINSQSMVLLFWPTTISLRTFRVRGSVGSCQYDSQLSMIWYSPVPLAQPCTHRTGYMYIKEFGSHPFFSYPFVVAAMAGSMTMGSSLWLENSAAALIEWAFKIAVTL